MPTVTRITSTGTLKVKGTFDEINGPLVTNGLTVWLEAENPNSYSGTGTAWNDLSGNGNHGTLVNSPSWTMVNGVRAFNFNGTNNRVSFSYQTPIQTTSTAFTWGVWLRANRNFDGDLVMGFRGTTPLRFYKLTTQKFEMYPAEIFSPLPLATWIYVCGVWNGPQGGADNLKTYMYVNGIEVGLRDGDTPDFSPSLMQFNIGGDVAANEWFQGSIAAAHVYNRALSREEVVQNFNARRQLFGQAATSSTTTVGRISMNTNTVFASTFDEVSLNAGSVSVTGGQYLLASTSTQFGLGTQDFTVEGWIYRTGTGAFQPMIDFRTLLNDVRLSIWYFFSNSVNVYSGSGTTLVNSGFTVALNTWYHIAVTRSSGNIRLFINGTQYGSTYSATVLDFGSSSDVVIGTAGDARGNAGFSMNGNVSNICITKGTALYTTNFTPPQSILDSTTATSLLLNVLTTSTFIKDNSSNQLTVTNVSAATFSTNGPFNQGNFAVKQRQLFNGTLEVSGMFDETDTLTTIGGTAYVTTGTFTWTVPADVTSISVLAVGGGGSGGGYGGGGGALAYKNNVAVTPGQTYSLTVGWPNPYNSEGSATSSTFGLAVPLVANGGRGGNVNGFGGSGGIGQGFDGGGAGGGGGTDFFAAGVGYQSGGSGGAGGYTASGGAGATYPGTGSASTGGGGGGGGFPTTSTFTSKGGGGVGIYGLGANGAASGGGGSGGLSQSGNVGGRYGGGGPGISSPAGLGATGVVRIIWPGTTRRFPSTGDLTAINETTI